jgi:hypothetical protein
MFNKTRTYLMVMFAVAIASAPAHALTKYNILSSGYYDGPSVSGAVGILDVFDKVPLGFELGLGYSWSDTGNAELACQVFINQAQVGRATVSSGGTLDLQFNALYPLNRSLGRVKFYALGGPRWARWNVRHQYLGGNEDFDVVGKVWGLGGGVRGIMELSKNFSAIMQLTLDYYPRASIYGHDATYYPDNNNSNARDNGAGYTYTYEDAVRATAVPHIRPRVMVGLMF